MIFILLLGSVGTVLAFIMIFVDKKKGSLLATSERKLALLCEETTEQSFNENDKL